MNIRLLHQEDWLAWKKQRMESLTHFPLAFSSSLEEEMRLSETMLQEWFNKHIFYAAFCDEQLVGSIGFLRLEPIKEVHRGILFGIGVNAPYQRRGIGDALMKTLIAHAKNYVLQLHLDVVSTNSTAIRLYQRHGFNIYGTEPRSLKWEGRFYDKHLMALFFDEQQRPYPFTATDRKMVDKR
ncbi:MAG: GNAT family N-acetyltransferase [Chthoniobacterales bacterium]|nr:GNAT family N-acetyltransferase [Chthoniobacterales bacterium]